MPIPAIGWCYGLPLGTSFPLLHYFIATVVLFEGKGGDNKVQQSKSNKLYEAICIYKYISITINTTKANDQWIPRISNNNLVFGNSLHPKILPQFDFPQNYQAEAHSIHYPWDDCIFTYQFTSIYHKNQPFNVGKYAIVPWIPWGPWRIIPVSRWLITMVSPLSNRVVPLPNGLFHGL